MPPLTTHFSPTNFLIQTRPGYHITLGKDCYRKQRERKVNSHFSISNQGVETDDWVSPGGLQEAGKQRTEIKGNLTKGGVYVGVGNVQEDHNVSGDARQIAPRYLYHSL